MDDIGAMKRWPSEERRGSNRCIPKHTRLLLDVTPVISEKRPLYLHDLDSLQKGNRLDGWWRYLQFSRPIAGDTYTAQTDLTGKRRDSEGQTFRAAPSAESASDGRCRLKRTNFPYSLHTDTMHAVM